MYIINIIMYHNILYELSCMQGYMRSTESSKGSYEMRYL